MKSPEKGVSLIITFFVMVIVLAVILSVSSLLYSEIKIIRNIGDSVIAFYAADSGAEKILYFDRQVFAKASEGQTISRGLCSIFDFNAVTNPKACVGNQQGSTEDQKSLYCNKLRDPEPLDTDGLGCDYDKCNNCKISFETAFNGKEYTVTATVSPLDDGSVKLLVESRGSFQGTARQINIESTKEAVSELITIANACVDPKSASDVQSITISANVSGQLYTISKVLAVIKDDSGTIMPDSDSDPGGLSLSLISGDYSLGSWSGTWQGPPGVYYVDLVAEDSDGNTRTESNIQSCN